MSEKFEQAARNSKMYEVAEATIVKTSSKRRKKKEINTLDNAKDIYEKLHHDIATYLDCSPKKIKNLKIEFRVKKFRVYEIDVEAIIVFKGGEDMSVGTYAVDQYGLKWYKININTWRLITPYYRPNSKELPSEYFDDMVLVPIGTAFAEEETKETETPKINYQSEAIRNQMKPFFETLLIGPGDEIDANAYTRSMLIIGENGGFEWIFGKHITDFEKEQRELDKQYNLYLKRKLWFDHCLKEQNAKTEDGKG